MISCKVRGASQGRELVADDQFWLFDPELRLPDAVAILFVHEQGRKFQWARAHFFVGRDALAGSSAAELRRTSRDSRQSTLK